MMIPTSAAYDRPWVARMSKENKNQDLKDFVSFCRGQLPQGEDYKKLSYLDTAFDEYWIKFTHPIFYNSQTKDEMIFQVMSFSFVKKGLDKDKLKICWICGNRGVYREDSYSKDGAIFIDMTLKKTDDYDTTQNWQVEGMEFVGRNIGKFSIWWMATSTRKITNFDSI